MNANGLTLQQMSVAVAIHDLWAEGLPPTTAVLSGVMPMWRHPRLGVIRRRTPLGTDAAYSVLGALVRRGLVRNVDVASGHARIRAWRLTREAEPLVEQWRRETRWPPMREAESKEDAA